MLNEHITLSNMVESVNEGHLSNKKPLHRLCDELMDQDEDGILAWTPWVNMTTKCRGQSQGSGRSITTGRTYSIGVYRVTHKNDIDFDTGKCDSLAYVGEGRIAKRVERMRHSYREYVQTGKPDLGTNYSTAGNNMAKEDPSDIDNWYYSFYSFNHFDCGKSVKKDIARLFEYRMVERYTPRFNASFAVHNRE